MSYRNDLSKKDVDNLELEHEITKEFLSGAATRFDKICPETLAMLSYLNHKVRTIGEIQDDLLDNDVIALNVRHEMFSHDLQPEYEENLLLDISELGLKHPIYRNLDEINKRGNALYIELVISQFTYYLDKLSRLGFSNFDEYLEKKIDQLKGPKHTFVLVNDWLDGEGPYDQPPRTKDYGKEMVCGNCEKFVKNKEVAETLRDERCN